MSQRLAGTTAEDFLRLDGVRLVRLAYLLTGDKTVAEDLAQEAMIKIYRSWNRVEGANDPCAYSAKILINLHRSMRRKRTVPTQDSPVSDAPTPGSAIDDLVVERITLRQALTSLPDRQRAAIVLRYYEGYSTEQVGDVLGITASSARSALSRGLENLRRKLRQEEDHGHEVRR